ncbi:hypothetical protein KEM55_002822 [Ascosphaera atra]|nr:hypothetical protein KEM55_002822 [Ascosphaera atra]
MDPQGRPETVQNSSAIPSVYQEMLSEFYTMSKAPEVPQKRKRVGQRPGPPSKRLQGEGSVPASETASVVSEPESKKPVQTTYDVDVSSDEDEEDIEWEDVAIAAPPPSEPTAVQEPAMPQLSDLQITFQKSEPAKKPRSTRKKAATAAERRVRLAAHKMHLLCLLSHVSTRNSWCNDEALQRELCKLLPSKCRSYLRPNEGLSQFARSTTFADGLKQALEIFHRKFKVVSPGMKRAYWVHDFSSKYNVRI